LGPKKRVFCPPKKNRDFLKKTHFLAFFGGLKSLLQGKNGLSVKSLVAGLKEMGHFFS
jgi:hypothetical protein